VVASFGTLVLKGLATARFRASIIAKSPPRRTRTGLYVLESSLATGETASSDA
jgi:hypothetical protein